jgi:hypothetical protein
MGAGLAIAGLFPWAAVRAGAGIGGLAGSRLSTWGVLWCMLAASIIVRAILGILEPTGARVRQAVGNAIMAIITLDAVLVLAACGEPWSILVLLLLVPFLFGRRIVSPT